MSETGTSNSNSDYFFGWDLLFKTVEQRVNKKADLLICLTHFILVKHFNFQCVGIGDDKTLSEDEIGSELLPDGWNDDDRKYALRYVHDKNLFILLGHISDGTLIINLMNIAKKDVSNIALEPNELVKNTKGRLKELIPDASVMADRMRKELVEPVFAGKTREVNTQTNASPSASRTDPLRVSEPRRPTGQFVPFGLEPRPFGFPDVGRGDLDPLGRGGPGNLLPFPSRPNLPGGIAQPRFDPFGPDPNVRRNPNPDHLPPPSFGGHDYYM